ncbi:D-glutamate cyclase, mitochondrial-like isoform X2 [Patiria miniata]|nr:D-glutamate cyclase, mitochondrial-like isoform X2 [Patiria miniata]XP_038072045.1 D-glutamate cyclase, mitochondrial-like isoform X2 [Patiria miniata]XP_038072046.1 D-glutamate cyclase, mitochondrial-like isoform X2 [Patiria miniata]XP_038072047.1 D-glutamate cyclase, mitochondrial-like isoform X2 [Patiria miniata]XP_038072048.1 D-glutamate cyclase, mitochondrial-like isoform X2 [Patiria miniata]
MPVPSREDLAQAEPEVARKLFRSGKFFKESTSGMCQGRVQTNLLALDKSLAEDFAKFCAANSGPLPVLFQSEVGQFTAPGLTQTDSDVRTDLPAYNIIENGEVTHTVKNIMGFKEFLRDYVFFYQGCSFTFDQSFLAAGVPLRNLEHNTRISVFTTSVKCHPVGPFKCQMDMSMRPIPRDLVEKAFKVTLPLTKYHGAPVHIGDPALIGVPDVNKPDYLDPTVFEEGDIPVFWACGVTVVEAVKAAKPSLAFSHFPGNMYIADAPFQSQDDSPADVKVVTLCEKPYWASVTSEAVVKKIKQLEGFIAEDLGKRQIGNLLVPDDLLKSVLALSHASSVALTTGFPCFVNNKNPYEDDGPPGAIAIAMMLQALGKKVDLVVDKTLYEPLTTVLEALVEQKVLARPISVVQFPPEGEQDTLETAKKFLLKAGTTAPRYDHLLAIERAGKAEDGGYYTMKAIDVGRLVGGIDWLFQAAAEMPTVHTSGIGDGGNELGMGKVRDIVHRDIPRGQTIACSVASDFLMTAGVSNWGGYAVAVGLYLVSTCPIHERYRRRAVGFPPSDEERQRFRSALPDVDRERQMLQILISHEFFDMTGTDVLHVDGLSFDDVHVKKIEQLLSVIGEE